MARPSAAYCDLLANEVSGDKIEQTRARRALDDRALIHHFDARVHMHLVGLTIALPLCTAQIRIMELYTKQRIVESIIASKYIPIVLLSLMLVIAQSKGKNILCKENVVPTTVHFLSGGWMA